MHMLRALLLVASVLPAAAAARDVIGPALREAMAEADDATRLAAYVVMSDRLSLYQLENETVGLALPARREYLSRRLRDYAAASQSQVRALLRGAETKGRAGEVRVLWAGNAVIFEADKGVIEQLATLPGIDRIRRVVEQPLEAYKDVPPPPAPAPADGATAPYPFLDDFESGVLEPWWSVTTTGTGQAVVSGAENPNGAFGLLVDSTTDSSESTVALELSLDLVGQTDVGLRFEWKEFNDEDDAADAVFISENGIQYFKVLDLTGGGSNFLTKAVELDDAIAAFGLSYTSDFRIRFSWSDNFSIPTDGFGFDDIEVAPGVGEPPPPEPTPNIELLQAPMLWDIGITGDGVLIGNIDSGVDFGHPDLANAAWGNPNEIPGNGIDDDNNGFVDDIDGWDFVTGSNDVTSFDSHGTNTAGLMVGDGANGIITGMAPDAKMIACEISGETLYWLAQQYCMDNGVDVISSSFSYKWPDPKPDYHMHRTMCEMELAFGIIHAQSIGNQGNSLLTYPIPWNVSAPGNAPGPFDHPQIDDTTRRTSIMGCAGIELDPLDDLYTPSGQGPSAWEDITFYDGDYPWGQDPAFWDYPYQGGALDGLLKPDMCTYTGGVTTTTFGQSYNPGFSGTSAATPQLGGAMLLLRQLQPLALPRHVAGALELTAEDLGPAGKDTRFGSGKVQVWDAARRLVLLAVAQDTTPAIGGPLVIDVHGEANADVSTFYGIGIQDAPGSDFDIAPPFFTLPVFTLDGAGEGQITGTIPNNPLLSGVTIWFQLGAKPQTTTFGAKPFASVPEAITID